MFLARRPSRQTIDRFLLDSQDLPLSYGPIGIVRTETARQGVDEVIVNTHQLPEVMADTARRGCEAFGLQLQLSHEPVLLGTG